MDNLERSDLGVDTSLLILDDDEPFTRTLGRAMERRGFTVTAILSVNEGLIHVKKTPPAYAIVDLRLGDGNGLDVVEKIRETRPDSSIVVLTGYGAIATAVAAVKIGAVDYLAKPADAKDITSALLSKSEPKPPPPEKFQKWGRTGQLWQLDGTCAVLAPLVVVAIAV